MTYPKIERNRPFLYIEKVLEVCVKVMKDGSKNKSDMFIFNVISRMVGWEGPDSGK